MLQWWNDDGKCDVMRFTQNRKIFFKFENKWEHLLNQKGGAEAIAITVLAASGLILFSLMTSFSSLNKMKYKSEKINVIQMVGDSIYQTVQSEDSWKKTIEMNSSTDCLKTNGAVCEPGGKTVKVYLAEGGDPLIDGTRDGSSSTIGMNDFGLVCDKFNPTQPNDECPYKFIVSWTPDCPGGSCPPTEISVLTGQVLKPRIQVSVKLEFAGSKEKEGEIVLNKRFDKSFFRGEDANSPEGVCRIAQGEFDPVTKKCGIFKGCHSHEILRGFDGSGNPICRTDSLRDIICDVGGVAMTSITSAGGVLCWKF